MTARSRTLATTLVLLAAAAGAVALAWFGVLKKDEKVAARKGAEERLYRFSPGDVQAVTVEAKGGRTRVVRAGDRWRVEEPVQADAERSAVTSLVERVAELQRKAAIADAPDPTALARYGLARPRAKLALQLADGRIETLALGDENPFDGTVFVRSTAGAVALVAGGLERTVERSTFDLREKRLLPFDDQEVRKVEVRTPRLAYALSRDGGAWRLEEPVAAPADPAAAGRVLAAVRGLRAAAFLDHPEDDRKLGLDPPRWKVTLVTSKGSRTADIGEVPSAAGDPGSAGRAVYARVAGSAEVAALPEGATKELDQDVGSLRARPEPKAADGGPAPAGSAALSERPGPPGAASTASAVDPERRRP